MFSVINLTKPSESADNSAERCRRNMSILKTKRIQTVEINGTVIKVRTSASSDPVLNSSQLITSMCADLSRRYPNSPYIK